MRYTITVEIEDLQDCTPEQVAEGIHARLFPVASCWPTELIATHVTVTTEIGA